MTVRERELRDKRVKMIADMRAILDKAATEKRDVTADENGAYERMEAELPTIERDIKREEDLRTREGSLDGAPDPDPEPGTRGGKPKTEVRMLIEKAERSGFTALSEVEQRICLDHIRSSFYRDPKSVNPQEARALQMDLDIYGGYLTVPQMIAPGLIMAKDRAFVVRRYAQQVTVTGAQSLGAVSLDNDPADPSWTGEITTASEDSTMSLGKRELTPHALKKLVKVSTKLLRNTGDRAAALVENRLSYKNQYAQEAVFMTGSGANQPLGLFTASDLGISTDRDVNTGNTSSAIVADNLIEVKYKVRSAYWNNCVWVFHQDAMKQIVKLKGGDGHYLFMPSIRDGEPDLLLGKRLEISEFCPNTFSSAAYVGLFGDLSYYMIADDEKITIQVLRELYAATGQYGFISEAYCDGMPVLEEAFARVKLGT